MFGEYQVEIIPASDKRGLAEVEKFLATFDLSFERELEYTVAVRLGDKLVGTGSFLGEVLRNVAVDESLQGSGLTALILSQLMQEQARKGRMHYFIFTKPSTAPLFVNLGFREIVRAEPHVALLESGLGSIDSYCASVAKLVAYLPEQRAAVVVNCNPFTKGHQGLIRKTASENDGVIVFVVSEDKSLFPFETRMKLVREGLADLPNVVVVPTGKYIISSATFPTYFTRDENKITAQTRLDVTLFASQIAPQLGITARYIGEEPYCSVTDAYNQAMEEIFPQYGIDLKIMKRLQVDEAIVSASKVRDLIRCGDWDSIRTLVPETTLVYLKSAEAQPIIEKIQHSTSRH